MSARILVVADDPQQADLIRRYLERDGHRVHVARSGRPAVDRCRQRRPDLVVLDAMMPRADGLDACRMLRTGPDPAAPDVPLLLVTASENRLLLDADDYLTKPYSPPTLTARVRALLHRTRTRHHKTAVITAGEVTVDPGRFEAWVAGQPVRLTAKEFGLLEVLAAAPQRVFTRAELIDRAFGFGRGVLERTVDAHVMYLRRKLGPQYIRTVYGRGYTFTLPDPD